VDVFNPIPVSTQGGMHHLHVIVVMP